MFKKIQVFLTKMLGLITWEWFYSLRYGKYYKLEKKDHTRLKKLLNPHYFIILTWRRSHLSSYAISLGHWVKTGRWGQWSHVLMNVDEGNCENDKDFKLLEAIGEGVKYSTFLEVFDCDRVCLLAPKKMSKGAWTQVIDEYLKQEGKEYDSLLDLVDNTKVNCVESVREALKILPDYNKKFHNFETMIKTMGNLTPDLFYECEDFKIVLEIKK